MTTEPQPIPTFDYTNFVANKTMTIVSCGTVVLRKEFNVEGFASTPTLNANDVITLCKGYSGLMAALELQASALEEHDGQNWDILATVLSECARAAIAKAMDQRIAELVAEAKRLEREAPSHRKSDGPLRPD